MTVITKKNTEKKNIGENPYSRCLQKWLKYSLCETAQILSRIVLIWKAQTVYILGVAQYPFFFLNKLYIFTYIP